MKKIIIILAITTMILLYIIGFLAVEYTKYKPPKPDYSCNLRRAYSIVGKTYTMGKEQVIYAISSIDDMGIIRLDYPEYDNLEEGNTYIFDFVVDSHIKEKDKYHKIQSIIDYSEKVSITPFSEDLYNPMLINYCS